MLLSLAKGNLDHSPAIRYLPRASVHVQSVYARLDLNHGVLLYATSCMPTLLPRAPLRLRRIVPSDFAYSLNYTGDTVGRKL